MKKHLASALLLAALLASGMAAEHKLTPKDPIATINLPDGWKVTPTDDGIDVESPDEEIYINVEVNDGDSIEGAIQETFGYLKKNKVKIDKATEKKQEIKVRGMDVVNFDWDGTDADGPTKVSLTILGITKQKLLLMLYWASPEGEKKHKDDLKKIQDSIKPIAK